MPQIYIIYQNTQEVKHECFLIWTRQNYVQILGILLLPLTKRQMNRQILYINYYIYKHKTDENLAQAVNVSESC